jgi:hypothetical protein
MPAGRALKRKQKAGTEAAAQVAQVRRRLAMKTSSPA